VTYRLALGLMQMTFNDLKGQHYNATYVTWPTSVCRRRLRTAVASFTLQSPGPSWCPGLGRPLTSTSLLRMAPGPRTDYFYQRPSDQAITRTVELFIQAPAQVPPIPALDSAGCMKYVKCSFGFSCVK